MIKYFKGFMDEFRTFAVKGNVIDLAVGVVIGTAFGKITNSLVADIIMPPLGMVTGGIDFSDYKIVLNKAAEGAASVTINYGMFLETLLNFVIIAFAMFLIIKAANKLRVQSEESAATAEPAPPPRSEVLLEEIRDAIKGIGGK